jgi:hypothetical protein
MAFWLWYRKGSFTLKERVESSVDASRRIDALAPLVQDSRLMTIGDDDPLGASLLTGAIELDSASGRLVF